MDCSRPAVAHARTAFKDAQQRPSIRVTFKRKSITFPQAMAALLIVVVMPVMIIDARIFPGHFGVLTIAFIFTYAAGTLSLERWRKCRKVKIGGSEQERK